MASLSKTMSDTVDTKIKLENGRIGSIKVDAILEDLSSLEYIKELSDTWVLSNIMDSILMTPEFIESCQAEDVSIIAVLNEESYQQFKSHIGEHIIDVYIKLRIRKKIIAVYECVCMCMLSSIDIG